MYKISDEFSLKLIIWQFVKRVVGSEHGVPLAPDLKRLTKQSSKTRKEKLDKLCIALPRSSNNEHSLGHAKLNGILPNNIHIQETYNSPPRKYDKKFYCIFCKESKSNLH